MTLVEPPYAAPHECTGIFRALVIDNNDPEQIGRIKMQVPQVFGEQVTNWSRTVLPFCDPPEIGTFVWAIFETGDRNFPAYFSNNLVVAEVGDVTQSYRTEKTGWLLLDGSSFNGTEYPELAEFLGSTTLPDPRGRQFVTAGAGPSLTDRPLGTSGGAEEVTLAITEVPSHDHPNTHTHANVHAHGLNSHTHGLNNHVHGMNSHTHALAAHAHLGNAHTHTANHTHALQAHAHDAGAHTHPFSDTFTLPSHGHSLSLSASGGSVDIDHSHNLPQHGHVMDHGHGGASGNDYVMFQGNNNAGLTIGSGGSKAFSTAAFKGKTQNSDGGISISGSFSNKNVNVSVSGSVGGVTGASGGTVSGTAAASSGDTGGTTTTPSTATFTLTTSNDGNDTNTGSPVNVSAASGPSTPNTEQSSGSTIGPSTPNTETASPSATDQPNTPNTGTRGGGLPHDNMPPYAAVNAFMYPGRRVPV